MTSTWPARSTTAAAVLKPFDLHSARVASAIVFARARERFRWVTSPCAMTEDEASRRPAIPAEALAVSDIRALRRHPTPFIVGFDIEPPPAQHSRTEGEGTSMMRPRRYAFLGLLLAIGLWPLVGIGQNGSGNGQWRAYSADEGSTRYS